MYTSGLMPAVHLSFPDSRYASDEDVVPVFIVFIVMNTSMLLRLPRAGALISVHELGFVLLVSISHRATRLVLGIGSLVACIFIIIIVICDEVFQVIRAVRSPTSRLFLGAAALRLQQKPTRSKSRNQSPESRTRPRRWWQDDQCSLRASWRVEEWRDGVAVTSRC